MSANNFGVFSEYGETLGSPKERYDEASDYGERFVGAPGYYGLLPAAAFDILTERKKHIYDEDPTEFDKLGEYLDELSEAEGEEGFKNTRWVKEHWNDYFPPKPDPKENIPEGEKEKSTEEIIDEAIPETDTLLKVKDKIDTNDNGEIEVDEMADFQKSLDDYASKNKKGREDIPATYKR